MEVDERKKDPLDFALWKATKPGEPSWESPWGPGRPGWHIECSAMSMQYLGETFDIHGGGEDLIFPHHENEIAQSEGATGRPFVRHWIHNGFVNMGAEKMSKSLGNTLLIRALLERHHPDSLRRYLLGTHYRNPLDFSEPRIHESSLAIGRLRNTIKNTSARAGRSLLPPEGEENTESSVRAAVAAIDDDRLRDRVAACVDGFVTGMDDDFNTPRALGSLADLGSEIVRHDGTADGGQPASAVTRSVQVLWRLGRALGFFFRPIDPSESTVERPEVQALLGEREAARRRRDWKRADEIRDQIEGMGLRIEDTPSGARVVQGH